MQKIRMFCSVLAAVFVVNIGIAAPVLGAAECHVKVGVVPQFEQRKLYRIWTPILAALKEAVHCDFELVGSKDIPAFEEAFKQGVYDIAYMNPYHALVANEAQGYVPLVRSGSKKLKGILVVRADSDIQSVKDLNGTKIAFPSPNALGAYLLMRTELSTLHHVEFEPMYVGNHPSVYLNTVKHITAAGGGVQRTLNAQNDMIKGKLRVLYVTSAVNAHPIVAHPRLGTDRSHAIQGALLKIAESKHDLTDKIPMKNPINTSMEDYQALKELGMEKFAK